MFCKILKRSFNNKSHEWNRKGSGRLTETPQAVKCVFKVNKERGKAACFNSGRREIEAISNLPNTIISRHFLSTWWFSSACYFSCSTSSLGGLSDNSPPTFQQFFKRSRLTLAKSFFHIFHLINLMSGFHLKQIGGCMCGMHISTPTHHCGRPIQHTHKSGNSRPRSLFSGTLTCSWPLSSQVYFLLQQKPAPHPSQSGVTMACLYRLI